MRRQIGRGIVEQDPVKVRNAAALQLRTMLKRYDLAEFQAQTHAANMVDMLAGFAVDVTQPVELRRQCANDVLDRAYGKPATKAKIEVVDTTANSSSGGTVGDEIRAAIVTADIFHQITDLTMRQVPYDEWPEELKAALPDGGVAFAVE